MLLAGESFPVSRPYEMEQQYSCISGYSLDGTPGGESLFTENCQATGKMTEGNVCKDIDWCLIGECGKHGKCIDALMKYTCECKPGYEVAFTDALLQTCVEINECETEDGDDNCEGAGGDKRGKCIDEVSGYKCECNAGYEMTEPSPGRQICNPIVCSPPPRVEHSRPTSIPKFVYKDTLVYTCHTGYSLNGQIQGGVQFTGTCEADKKVAGMQECKRIECGKVRKIDNAEVDSDTLFYQDTAAYTCDTGFTTTGSAKASTDFEVECKADGSITEPMECLPISCGQPSLVANANAPQDVLLYDQSVVYNCDEGYSSTGAAVGTKVSFEDIGAGVCELDNCVGTVKQCTPQLEMAETQIAEECAKLCDEKEACEGYSVAADMGCFLWLEGPLVATPRQVTSFGFRCNVRQKQLETAINAFKGVCQEDGHIAGLQKCKPVECGFPKTVANSEMPSETFEFPQQFQVVCDAGYTVDASPQGESTFMVQCGADAVFHGYQACKAVTCGKPQPTDHAASSNGETFFKRLATWTCNDGFSLDGTPGGPTKFQKECGATGDFGTASPSECQDIDFCHGDPCTANGVCTDDGEGTAAPGYTCECNDGFETKERENGGKTCTEDDCQGAPCGRGGTCTDKSKDGAPEGTYACDCDAGYKLVEEVVGKPKCERVACPALAPLKNVELADDGLPALEVDTWKGNDPEIDVLYSMPILESFDTAQYTCAEGYSSDGTTHVESKTFMVACEGSGLYSPRLSADLQYCVKIECDTMYIPEIMHTNVYNKQLKYVFGDQAQFRCSSGYTIGGCVGCKDEFELLCEKNGRFTDRAVACSPVSCKIPKIDNAVSSKEGTAFYGQSVTYTCSAGFYLNGAVSEHTMGFGGKCSSKGSLDIDVTNPNCKPANCGEPSVPEHAIAYKMSSTAPNPSYKKRSQKCNAAGKSIPLGTVSDDGKTFRCKGSYCLPMRGRCNGVKNCGDGSDEEGCEPSAGVQSLQSGETFIYEEVAYIRCESGFTVGGVPGGSQYYEQTCGADGQFAAGTPTSGQCLQPTYPVTGKIVDAQDGNDLLSAAKVTYVRRGTPDEIVVEGTSNSFGKYSFSVGEGTYEVTAEKVGFITNRKNVTISGPTSVGQGADLALRKVLGPGEFSITLNWNLHSNDLDSWTFWDAGFDEFISYYHMRGKLGPQSGVKATLDWDDTDGYGPETTSLYGIGNCTSKCLVKFHVDNYTPDDGKLGDSGLVVKLMRGQGVFKEFRLDDPSFDKRGKTIFTMDASTDPPQVYEGNWRHGPFLRTGKKGRDYWDMEGEGWQRVGEGNVLYKLQADGTNALFKLDTVRYYQVQNSNGVVRTEHDWSDALVGAGKASCPAGSWLSGVYRSGSAFDTITGIYQITKGECSSYTGITRWGKCQDIDAFQNAEGPKSCEWNGPYKPAYSPGCSQGCKQYKQLSQAKSDCAKRDDCGGVTYEKHGGNRWRWELRKGTSTKKSPHGETTFLKGRCSNVGPSDAQCPIIDGQPSAFVGLKKLVNKDDPDRNKLSGLKLAECCTFPDELVSDQANDCVNSQVCLGQLGEQ